MVEQPRDVPANKSRLELLDYLRLVAALAVVGFHWTFNGINNGKIASLDMYGPLAPVSQYGYLGVEVFFIISGYVIMNSARGRTAESFAVGRLVRLYPAFWTALAITSAVSFLWGSISGFSVTWGQILVNTTMIPTYLGVDFVDGAYWTLALELQFYLLVFVLLAAGAGRAIPSVIAGWSGLMLAVTLLVPSVVGLPYAGGYYALFAVGALLAELHRRHTAAWVFVGFAAALTTALVGVYRGAGVLTESKGEIFNPLVSVGIVATVVVVVAVAGTPRAAGLRLAGSRTAGALTYPVYLLHAHIGYIVISHFATEENRYLVYAVLLACLLLAAWVLHQVVEVRLGPVWFRFFGAMVGWLFGLARSVRQTSTRQEKDRAAPEVPDRR